MARILVRPEELEALAGKFRQAAGDLRMQERNLSQAVQALDWEVRQKAGIDADMAQARGRVQAVLSLSEAMADRLSRQAKALADADQAGHGVTGPAPILATGSAAWLSAMMDAGMVGTRILRLGGFLAPAGDLPTHRTPVGLVAGQAAPVTTGPRETRLPNVIEVEQIQRRFGIVEAGYGERTREAVRAFQQEHGIPVDGQVMVGPRTWRLMFPAPLPEPATGPLDNATYRAAQSNWERLDLVMPYFLRNEQEHGVPWQVQAAQWAVESAWGVATPKDAGTGQESFNLFGIKGTGPAGSVSSETTEHLEGQDQRVSDRFRAYGSYEESISDYGRLLQWEHYAPAQACGGDLRCWVERLGPEHCGYATDPGYPEKLWAAIQQVERLYVKPGVSVQE